MNKMLSRRLAQGATLVVDDRLAGAQLEAYIARESGLLEAGAWRSPDIQTEDNFCASLWAANCDRDRLLLSAKQSDALWRSIVSASSSGADLIDSTHIAIWARQAWGLLQAWQLEFRELRARDDDPGFADFLTWAAQFEDALSHSSWVDKHALSRIMAEQLTPDGRFPSYVVRADIRNETPAQQSLSRRLTQAGSSVDTWSPDPVSKVVRRVGLEDAREELRRAVSWAQRKLDDVPTARVALVMPDTVDNALHLERYLGLTQHEGSRTYRMAEGTSVNADPAIGAALDCLGLFSERADFEVLSRWLRSPFVGRSLESLTVRCLVEADLRGELVAQFGFLTAYRKAGLDRKLSRKVPMLCAAVDGVLDRLGRIPRNQSSTRWAGVFQELLNDLGWPGTEVPVPGPVLDAWQRALEELSGLTPILKSIDYERALAELRAGVSAQNVDAFER